MNAVTHVPSARKSVSEGCGLWAVGGTPCAVVGEGITWEDQEMGRVYTGARELESAQDQLD